jgi:hypothetical protein
VGRAYDVQEWKLSDCTDPWRETVEGSGNTGDDEPYAVRHQLRVEDNPGITGTTGVVETDANGVTDGSSLWDLDRVDALLTALEWARRIVAAGTRASLRHFDSMKG